MPYGSTRNNIHSAYEGGNTRVSIHRQANLIGARRRVSVLWVSRCRTTTIAKIPDAGAVLGGEVVKASRQAVHGTRRGEVCRGICFCALNSKRRWNGGFRAKAHG